MSNGQPQYVPQPRSDIWEWQMHGACRGADTSVFFHPDGERGRARIEREARAKAICYGCPVRTLCRDHALAVEEPYGTWGGMSESERALVLRLRTERSENQQQPPHPRVQPTIEPRA